MTDKHISHKRFPFYRPPDGHIWAILCVGLIVGGVYLVSEYIYVVRTYLSSLPVEMELVYLALVGIGLLQVMISAFLHVRARKKYNHRYRENLNRLSSDDKLIILGQNRDTATRDFILAYLSDWESEYRLSLIKAQRKAWAEEEGADSAEAFDQEWDEKDEDEQEDELDCNWDDEKDEPPVLHETVIEQEVEALGKERTHSGKRSVESDDELM